MKAGMKFVDGGLLAAWIRVGAWTVAAAFHPTVWLLRMPVVTVDAESSVSVATFGPLTLNTRRAYR